MCLRDTDYFVRNKFIYYIKKIKKHVIPETDKQNPIGSFFNFSVLYTYTCLSYQE
jgi:hypothetical protein